MDHIVTSFDEELASIKNNVVRMGGIAEAQLASAIEALVKRDPELADRVVESDQQIDDLELDLNEKAVDLLALRQPVANVAKRTKIVSELPPIQEVGQIRVLAQLVQEQIKSIIDAIVESDEQRAIEVWHGDQKVDEHYAALFRSVLGSMASEGRDVEACTHLLFIAKNIERIGDHTTNIAELLYYQVTGRQIEGGRPKGTAPALDPVREMSAK